MGFISRLLLLLHCASHGSSLRTNQSYLCQRSVRKPHPAATLEFIKRRSPPNVPPFSTPSRADRSCPVTDMDHRGWSTARRSAGRTRGRMLQSLSTHSILQESEASYDVSLHTEYCLSLCTNRTKPLSVRSHDLKITLFFSSPDGEVGSFKAK